MNGISMDLCFGYGSKRDDERYKIYLCDECFDKMVGMMGIDLDKVKVDLD